MRQKWFYDVAPEPTACTATARRRKGGAKSAQDDLSADNDDAALIQITMCGMSGLYAFVSTKICLGCCNNLPRTRINI